MTALNTMFNHALKKKVHGDPDTRLLTAQATQKETQINLSAPRPEIW
jgi:hypothetical protein